MNINDNHKYVVKCSQENFEDVLCMVKMCVRVIEADATTFSIKTFSLDSCLKKRLTDTGASFWQEPVYQAVRVAAGRR